MKSIWLGILVGVLATFAFAPPASAVPLQITVIGNAQGCFGLGCSPAEAAATVMNGVPLAYTSSVPVDFSGTTNGGSLAVDDGTTGNFGSISLGRSPSSVAMNVPFMLQLSFVTPTGPALGLFQGLISGVVSPDPSGGVQLAFSPTSQSISFTHGLPGDLSGMLTALLDNISLAPGGTAPLTGLITAGTPGVSVPEPDTLGLMGIGLAAILGLAWRRRRNRELA